MNEINEKPVAYIGRKVKVGGEIEEVYGPRAFTIRNPDVSSDELLIVATKDFPEIPDSPERVKTIEDDLVQITGEVQRYIPEEIQRQIGDELDSKVESDYPVSHPVVFAESLHFTAQIKKDATDGIDKSEKPRNDETQKG